VQGTSAYVQHYADHEENAMSTDMIVLEMIVDSLIDKPVEYWLANEDITTGERT